MPSKNNDNINIFLQLIPMFKDIILGLIGGIVAYLLKFQKEREININYPFSFGSLIINMILGGYVSYLVGSGLPETFQYRDFIVGSVGVASYPILTFIKSNFLALVLKKIKIEITDTKQTKD